MRYFLTLLMTFIFCVSLLSQEEETLSRKELKSIAKEEKRARKNAEEEQLRKLVSLMMEYQRFVLEAEFVGDQTGQRIPVNSTINFIAVDSSIATLQLGTPHGVGYNGVGGVTVDGKITKYDLKEVQGKRSKSYHLMLFISSSMGPYNVSFNISETGYSDATVRGNSMGQLKYSGKIVPISMSRVYKGTTLF